LRGRGGKISTLRTREKEAGGRAGKKRLKKEEAVSKEVWGERMEGRSGEAIKKGGFP